MPNHKPPRHVDPDGTCRHCDQPHLRPTGLGHPAVTCAAHTGPAKNGKPCGQFRPQGAPDDWTCGSHGGNAGQVKAKRERVRQRAEVEKLMLTLGEPIDDGRDYSEVIADRVAMRRGHVAWLLARVQAIDPDALAWGMTRRKTAVEDGRWLNNDDDAKSERRKFAGNDEGDTFEAKPSIWWAMYEDSAVKLEKLCIEAIRVGVEQRRLQMDERMADTWVRAIDGIVTALGHDPNAPETAEIVARHLELVA